MKILAIGDPHGNMKELRKIDYSNVDLILVPGDFGEARLIRKMAYTNIDRRKNGLSEIEYLEEEKEKGFMQVYDSSMKVIRYLSSKAPVFLIFGNVELSNFKTEEEARKSGEKISFLSEDLEKLNSVKVINDVVFEFNGIKIGGLKYFIEDSWVEKFVSTSDRDYKKKLNDAKKETLNAKEVLKNFGEVDILMCHQPPFGVLDKVVNPNAPRFWQGKHAGSELILEYIKEKRPKYVICGHIHEGKGEAKVGKSVVYNLGVCGRRVISL